ncbi:hypothetical protein J6590_098799, partial [Homalodisca vitripennis]
GTQLEDRLRQVMTKLENNSYSLMRKMRREGFIPDTNLPIHTENIRGTRILQEKSKSMTRADSDTDRYPESTHMKYCCTGLAERYPDIQDP